MGKLHTLIDATRITLRDPTDTSQVFRIAEVLSLGTPRRLARRFRQERPDLLAAKPDLLARLADREGLESLPAGSVGRAYLTFIDAEGITADGLVEASRKGRTTMLESDPDVAWVSLRMRDSHDLWHTITGYHGDLLGETALLAFTFAQTRHLGIGFLAGLGIVLSSIPIENRGVVTNNNAPPLVGPEERRFVRRFIVDGFKRGRRAQWFAAQSWESLLAEPLEDVRRRLGVAELPAYEQVRPIRSAG